MTVNVGIVGLGAIGNFLVDKVESSEEFKLTALYDLIFESYQKTIENLSSPPPFCTPDKFPDDTDVFIECASQQAVEPVVREALIREKTVIVASIGGLVDNPDLWEIIKNSNGKLVLPSGAIGGLDILKAIDKSDIESISLTTRKNPKSLPDKYKGITSETEVFRSNASEAIKEFPKNTNVAALLSLAGIGAQRTEVRIVADPNIDLNTHEIEIVSKVGNYSIKCANLPFEGNPMSSKLAALSIWAALKSMSGNVVYGM